MPRFLTLVLFLVPSAAAAQDAKAPPVPTELTDYVARPEPDFAWKLVSKVETPLGSISTLEMTSQRWQGIVWKHGLQIVVPKGASPQSTMVLWNQGGSPSTGSAVLALQIAERVQAPVAFLYGVPNQPLFGGKKEDVLIAETFVRYLETGDGTWPLLFPMVKSVTKSMDVLQAFAKQEWKSDVTHFVVTGASKRGWTSWLTAATGDPRVKAIAPIVIDTLKFPQQMRNQVTAFGKPSEMIADYTRRGLVPIPKTATAQKLWQLIDPWVYRDKLTLPKLIVNGTNDPYWPLDALNSYWDDLRGPKAVAYIPNAGHDLRETDETGSKQLLPMRAVDTLAAFCKSQIFDKPLPTLAWDATDDGIKLTPVGRVKRVALWTATSTTRDFRKSRWTENVAPDDPGKAPAAKTPLILKLPEPGEAFTAAFGEVVFDFEGLPLHLCTQIRILEPKKSE